VPLVPSLSLTTDYFIQSFPRRTMFSSLFFIGTLVASAAAHGYVDKITIAGKEYAGPEPGNGGPDSAIRQVRENSPVKGTDNVALNCGLSAKRAKLSADAMPGDEIQISWPSGGGQTWPHNTGPMMTYLAECDGPCEDFDAKNAQWFKIDQAGKNDNGKWVQEDLMSGKPATITLPSSLAAGNYLLRHEIIALHLATEIGGAEFYPSCAQLSVGGNESGKPSEDELVSFPGAYKEDDPGIFVPDVFGDGKYDFPGPRVASLANGGESGSGNTDNTDGGDDNDGKDEDSEPTPSSTAEDGEPTVNNGASSSGATGGCKLKKRTPTPSSLAAAAKRNVKQYKPRHLSRVMRNVALDFSH